MINPIILSRAIGHFRKPETNLETAEEVINAIYRISQTRPDNDNLWFESIERECEYYFEIVECRNNRRNDKIRPAGLRFMDMEKSGTTGFQG